MTNSKITQSGLSRRGVLKGTAAAGAGIVGGTDLFNFAQAWAQGTQWKPEAGAKLNVLRWKRFVPAEDDAFMKLVAAFQKATGVEMNITNESFDDIQPKASVAASTGQGPDMVWGLHSLPHLFPDKLVDMTDVADYLGKKYGGWVPAAEQTCRIGNKWLAAPIAFNLGQMNYRIKAMNDAGFKEFPTDLPGFLALCKAMKAKNTPSGFAFGHATGDANGWLHWLLWAHDGWLIDENNKVIINSPETAKALEYAKALYETFIPGTASWNDSSNNKAFLAGELYVTSNGISIYAAALADAAKGDTKMKAIAEDMDHAVYPNGVKGTRPEMLLCFPMMTFQYSKFPNAAKAFTAFLMEAEQHGPWLSAAVGYLTATLFSYETLPFWKEDKKRIPYSVASKASMTAAGRGKMGEAAAAAIADFLIVDMFANYVTGREDVKGAIALAERSAKRLYR